MRSCQRQRCQFEWKRSLLHLPALRGLRRSASGPRSSCERCARALSELLACPFLLATGSSVTILVACCAGMVQRSFLVVRLSVGWLPAACAALSIARGGWIRAVSAHDRCSRARCCALSLDRLPLQCVCLNVISGHLCACFCCLWWPPGTVVTAVRVRALYCRLRAVETV